MSAGSSGAELGLCKAVYRKMHLASYGGGVIVTTRATIVMVQITLTNGASFVSAPNTSILDAATQAQITLPYSCKTGRCNTCKCKIIKGTTRALFPEPGLTEQEMAEGWVLGCARTAETDVLVEAENILEIKLPTAKTWPCRISKITFLASDVACVLLRLPPTADFQFIPGQYVDVIGPNGIRRSYSLANSNFVDKTLELHIRAVPGGAMSEYWFGHAKPNDLLRLNGPLGTFVLQNTSDVDLVFLATGTGIAPVKSMLESMRDILPGQEPNSVTVLWGGRKEEDFYLNIAEILNSVTYIPVLSRNNDEWTGAKGYIQDVLIGRNLNLMNTIVYACGSDAMIHGAKVRLIEAGLPAKHFHSDAFVRSGVN